jgi:hypothetical protein
MHGINNLKVINAEQARTIGRYKNTKEKLLKTVAAVWFNKMCRLNNQCLNICILKLMKTMHNGAM